MKVGALTGKALNDNNQESETVRYQEGDGYLNDLRLESFGHLLADYILTGANVTRDLKDRKKLTVSEGIISFKDQLWRVYNSQFRTAQNETTYYLGFLLGQGYVFVLSKPMENYLPLWEVTTSKNGDISTLIDKRGTLGRVKYKAIYDGVYLNTTEVQAAIDAAVAVTNDAQIIANEVKQALIDAGNIVNETKFVDEFSLSTTYKANNFVSYDGSTFMAKKGSVGKTPIGTPGDVYWALVSEPGRTGPQGETGDIGPPGVQGEEGKVGPRGSDGTGTVVRHHEEFITTENQKVFNLQHTYDQFQNRIDVSIGGSDQYSPFNFTESSPKSFTLAEGVPAGLPVNVTYFSNAVPLSTDLETVVDNLKLQVAIVLAELEDGADGGLFTDTTTGITLDGGGFL